ncbi:MAG TPA: hypothetical protein V6D09_19210 [Leptolyngbyaceae cyanobacterium]
MQEPKVSFDYALMLGTLKTPTHLQLMQWQANNAVQHFLATGQMTDLYWTMPRLTKVWPHNNVCNGGCLKGYSYCSCRRIVHK